MKPVKSERQIIFETVEEEKMICLGPFVIVLLRGHNRGIMVQPIFSWFRNGVKKIFKNSLLLLRI